MYSCLMQINKCSVLCTTIMRPVVTEAAIAVLTIIFPRGRGQCGVCKMRPCYMFLVSMCSCLNCLLARPNLPVSMFTPRLSIILGHCLHTTTATSRQPGRGCKQGSGNFYNIILNYAARNGTILLSNVLLSVDLYIQHKTVCLKRSNREQYFPCSNSTCMTET